MFNTAISQMMIFINECYKNTSVPYEYLEGFLKLLNPIAPHLTEELYQIVLNKNESIAYSKWPKYDENKIKDDIVTIVIQINGKIREKLEVKATITDDELQKKALECEKIKTLIGDNPIKKVIVVPKKIVNIVI